MLTLCPLLTQSGHKLPLMTRNPSPSHYSSKPRVLASVIEDAMDHNGFSIVHVQSPCTTYNDTFSYLKGDRKQGIEPGAWEIPEDHDPTSRQSAIDLLERPGVPLGVIYREEFATIEDRQSEIRDRVGGKTPRELLVTYAI